MAADEPLVELETDKVTVEVNAPAGGRLGPHEVTEGSEVEVGTLLGRIESGAGASPAPRPAAQAAAAPAPAAPATREPGRRHSRTPSPRPAQSLARPPHHRNTRPCPPRPK